MELPLQITSRNFKLFEDVETKIRNEAEKLNKFYDRIMRCRVVVEVSAPSQPPGQAVSCQDSFDPSGW